eukprot:COSAG06_NODE_8190_length_2244_cov_2.294639_2_plen_183_part_00
MQRLYPTVCVHKRTPLTPSLDCLCQTIDGREPEWVTRERAKLEDSMAVRLTSDADLLKENYDLHHHKALLDVDIALRMHLWKGRVSKPKTVSLAATSINPELRKRLVDIFYSLDQTKAGALTSEQLHSFAEDGILAMEHLTMDVDETGRVTMTEWLDGWENRGHSDEEIREFVESAEVKIKE